MRTWLSPNANLLIFRHFHLGSQILEFIARNTRGVNVTTTPLKPTRLADVRNHLYLQHDINLFNFVIALNEQLRERALELAPIDELDFSCITDGPLPIEPMPDSPSTRLPLPEAVALLVLLGLVGSYLWRRRTPRPAVIVPAGFWF